MNDDSNLQPIKEMASESEVVKYSEKSKKQREAERPTRAKLRFIEAAHKIKSEPPELRPAGFLPKFLIQCTPPHTDPGNVPIWHRTNNEETLSIQPGWDFKNNCPLKYPYGTLPRLLLIWMVTEAVRTSCRRLKLGASLTEFLHKLELEPYSRGKRSAAKRIKEAMNSLFSAKIVHHRTIRGTEFRGKSIHHFEGLHWKPETVISEGHVLWNLEKGEHQDELGRNSWIELSPDFFAAIMESPVPFNMDAVRELRKSPLQLDLYALVNWLSFGLKGRGKESHFLEWSFLQDQLGSNYSDRRDLKKNVRKSMAKIAEVHSELRWEYVVKNRRGGIMVYPSIPAIPPKQRIQ